MAFLSVSFSNAVYADRVPKTAPSASLTKAMGWMLNHTSCLHIKSSLFIARIHSSVLMLRHHHHSELMMQSSLLALCFHLSVLALIDAQQILPWDEWPHQRILVNKDVSIHLRYAGSGPPVLLLHGNPQHSVSVP